MKPWLAFVIGLVACFAASFLVWGPINLFNSLCLFASVKLGVSVPPFTSSHIFISLISSHMFECLVGGLFAGYLAKKSGTLIGALVAYSYLIIEFIIFLCCARVNSFFSSVAAQKLFTGYDVNWNELLYVTALLLGTLGGKAGEVISQRRRRNSPPSSA